MAALIHIVDDDPTIRQIACRLAEAEGFASAGFASMPEFLAAVARQPPDVLLLDLAIGDEDGIAVLEALAGRGLGCAIMVMSGLDARLVASAVRIGHALGLAMLDPLPKPFDLPGLRRRLRTAAESVRPIEQGDLDRAIENDELVPYYQPKICLRTMRPVGCEALARWRHPIRGLIGPKDFISLAEESSRITLVTYRMIEQALGDLARWSPTHPDFSVAVNVSALSLVEPAFPERVFEILSRNGARPGSLTLEVTETAAMSRAAAAAGCLTRLRIRGVALALDDFGTGYSSMAELHRLPFSTLKIDQSFVTGMETDADAQVIVKAIIGLAQTLGMRAVAEGVETLGSLRMLREMGCDVAQGYHIGRPMPAEAFGRWLTEWTSPLPAPVQAPVPTSVQAPLPAPVQASVQAPMSTPLTAPMSTPVTAPLPAPLPAKSGEAAA